MEQRYWPRHNQAGSNVNGFIGRSASTGKVYLAHPTERNWQVFTCNEREIIALVAHLSVNPEPNMVTMDAWSEKNQVRWEDQGNGILLYSQDMTG